MTVYVPRFRRTLNASETAANKKAAQNKVALNMVVQLYKCGAITSVEVCGEGRGREMSVGVIGMGERGEEWRWRGEVCGVKYVG